MLHYPSLVWSLWYGHFTANGLCCWESVLHYDWFIVFYTPFHTFPTQFKLSLHSFMSYVYYFTQYLYCTISHYFKHYVYYCTLFNTLFILFCTISHTIYTISHYFTYYLNNFYTLSRTMYTISHSFPRYIYYSPYCFTHYLYMLQKVASMESKHFCFEV